MLAKIQSIRVLVLAGIICLGASVSPLPLLAQFLDDSFSRENFSGSDGDFAEDTGGFGQTGPEDDFTEGGQFVDEDQARTIGPGGITIRGRSTQLRLERERNLLPLNVAWGAGTGLLIGGWFALIDEGSDRDTQRAIGLGIVLGGLLGMTVGLKTVIAPDAPRAAMRTLERDRVPELLTVVAAPRFVPPPFRLGFTYRF